MAEYTIKIEGVERLRKALQKSPIIVKNELSKAIKTSVNIIRPMMRQQAPKKSGKLSRNITARASGLRGEVGPNLSATFYALYVHNGTSPYVIRPRSKKALYWKGASHPVRMVRHPGIKANPFVERTADQARSPINRIFGKAIDRIVFQIAKK